jgi:hypothetical protein
MVTANFTGRGVRLPGSTGEVLITTGPGTEPGGELGPWQGLITRAARERAE